MTARSTRRCYGDGGQRPEPDFYSTFHERCWQRNVQARLHCVAAEPVGCGDLL